MTDPGRTRLRGWRLLGLALLLAMPALADIIWLELGSAGAPALDHTDALLTAANLANYTAEVRNGADQIITTADLSGLDEAASGYFVGVIQLGELSGVTPITLVLSQVTPYAVATVGSGAPNADDFLPTLDRATHGITAASLTWNVNGPPTANPDSYTIAEDTELFVAAPGLLDNDVDTDPMTASLATAPATGTATVAADGSFTFSPPLNAAGEISFTYAADDGNLSATSTVTITITPVNDPPQATADGYTTDEDTAVSDDVLANDADPDEGDVLTVSVVTPPPRGDLTLLPSGAFTYTPAENDNGEVSFSYSVSDTDLADSATVTITITPVNDPPTVVGESITFPEDSVLFADLLANDSDVDLDSLSASLVLGPATGSFTFEADGSLTYVPVENATDTVFLTYSVSDEMVSVSATATITMSPVNDVPELTADSYTTAEDTPLPGDLSANDFDVEGGLLYISVTPAAFGSVVLLPDGSFTYTPNENATGLEQLLYTVTDTEHTVSAALTMQVDPVNDPPLAEALSVTTSEDEPVSGTLPSSDLDTAVLTHSVVEGPGSGTLTLLADGSFTYEPDGDFNGADSFRYAVSDVEYTVSNTVSLSISPVNDPAVAVADSVTTDEDQPVSGSLATNDTDDQHWALVYSASATTLGTLVVDTTGGFSYTPSENLFGNETVHYSISDGSFSITSTLTIQIDPVNDAPVITNDTFTVLEDTPASGSVADADVEGGLSYAVELDPPSGAVELIADGSFTYNPAENVTGDISFSYRVTDGAHSLTGLVTITLTPQNDPPDAVDDSYTALEDQPIAGSVVDNDVDPDSALVVTKLSEPTNGTLIFADGNFAYQPNLHFDGSDSFLYRIADEEFVDSATVTFTFTPENDPPQAVADSHTGEEDILLVNSVASNDFDPEGGLTFIKLSDPVAGALTFAETGAYTFLAPSDQSGSYSFLYRVFDGEFADSATVTITIEPVNDPPTVTDDAFTIDEDETLNDSIADEDLEGGLVYSVHTEPFGTLFLSSDGTFTYAPVADFNGEDVFIYSVVDGGIADSATVTITIEPVNDPPVAIADAFTVVEDMQLVDSVAPDQDIDSAGLVYTALNQPAHGNLVLDGSGAFTLTPSEHRTDGVVFTYQVSDGEFSVTTTATIAIIAQPDPPVAVADSATLDEDATLIRGEANGLLANDSDPDGDALVAALFAESATAEIVVEASGAYTYTPVANFFGEDVFAYSVTDGGTTVTALVTITVNPRADSPEATADSYTLDEDTELVLAPPGPLANDEDPDGDELSFVALTMPAGQLTFTASGALSYVPVADATGNDSFSYRATDGALNSPVRTVAFVILPVNDAPVALLDNYVLVEDGSVSDDLQANDSDVDLDPLETAVLGDPAHGAVTLLASGAFTYTPVANFAGSDQFSYSLSDGTVSVTQLVTLTVTAENDAPVAVADEWELDEDATLTVTAPGVLENDSDIDSPELQAQLLTAPATGELTLLADGSFTFVPAAEQAGVFSFSYQTHDGAAASESVVVTVTVTALNDPPISENDAYETGEDETLSIAALAGGVLDNDVDVDGPGLFAVLTSNANHSLGQLSLSADGSFLFIPTDNASGTALFTYQASDGLTVGNHAILTITINAADDAPVTMADSYTFTEDTALVVAVAGPLANDSDIDSVGLTAQVVQSPAAGQLTLLADGAFTYTPDAQENAADSFVYAAHDGTSATTGVVTLVGIPVNDPPAPQPDAYSLVEDETVSVPAVSGVLANDDDVDGDGLTATVLSEPATGTLTLVADGAFTYVPAENVNGEVFFSYSCSDGQLSRTATVTLTITAENDAPVAVALAFSVNEDATLEVGAGAGLLALATDVDGDSLLPQATQPTHGTLTIAADGAFTYVPDADFAGADAFTATVDDGLAQSAAVIIGLVVEPINDAPTPFADAYLTQEDTTLFVTAEAGVLSNDDDVEDDALATTVQTEPVEGTLTLAASGAFTYEPAANFDGQVSFVYTVSDGEFDRTASVTIVVGGNNDLPTAEDDAFTLTEDVVLEAPSILLNDDDPDGDELAATLLVPPSLGELTLAADGTFTFEPTANAYGEDSFSYQATDGQLNSSLATVRLSISAVADAPVAEPDSYTMSEDGLLTPSAGVALGANDGDVDSPVLSFEVLVAPATGTLEVASDGTFTYAPAADANADVAFSYTVSDGALSDTGEVSIVIEPVNDAPVFLQAPAFITDEDQLLSADLAAFAQDIDSATLEFGIVAGAASQSVAGTFTFDPPADAHGPFELTATVSDGELSATTTVTITVLPVNDAPQAGADAFTVDEDGLWSGNLTDNDNDVDGDGLLVASVTPPAQGSLSLAADGAFSYEPHADANGPDQFVYRITDPSGAANSATVVITITPVNDSPTVIDATYTLLEDTTLVVPAPGALAGADDVDGDALALMVLTAPASGVLEAAATGAFTYVPAGNDHGSRSFVFVASDGTEPSASATITLTILPQNDPPVALADSFTTAEDTAIAGSVLSNDTDLDQEAISAILGTGPGSGALTLEADGSFTFEPEVDAVGDVVFSYAVFDGTVASVTTTVTITVEAVNDRPVVAADSYTVLEDGTLAGDLSENDSDVDQDVLSLSVLLSPATGQLQLDSSGAFTYVPALNQTDPVTFTYLASDGALDSLAGSVLITIVAQNDAPIALGDAFLTDEDTAFSVAAVDGLLANDSDVDDLVFEATLATEPVLGTITLTEDGAFTYVPEAEQNGVDTFSYAISDGEISVTALISITIQPVNDPPVGTAESFTAIEDLPVFGNLLDNDSDIDEDELEALLQLAPDSGELTLLADGSFTYQPALNATAPVSFQYLATDTRLSSGPTLVTITIEPVNDAPTVTDDAFTTDEDEILNDSIADADVEGGLVYSVHTEPIGILNLSSDGSFGYTPPQNFNGLDVFIYAVIDGEFAESATVTITVDPVNDAPTVSADAFTLEEDMTLRDTIADEDVEGGLTYSLQIAPAGGLVLLSDGSFTYTPIQDFNGQDEFVYAVVDGLFANSATVSLTVSPVNDPPTITDDAFTANEDETLNDSIADTDLEGGLVYSVEIEPSGTLNLSSDGSFTYAPPQDFNGQDVFIYAVVDGLFTNSATVTITVLAVNDPPVAVEDSYSVDGNQLLVSGTGVLANDDDVDSAGLEASVVTSVAHGTLTLLSDGSFSYEPGASFTGEDSFTYQATDGEAVSHEVTVSLVAETREHTVPIAAGWQLMSVPGSPHQPMGTMFGNCAVAVYRVTAGGLVAVGDAEFLLPGTGYWAFSAIPCESAIFTSPVRAVDVAFGAGDWAVVGALQAGPWPGPAPLIIWRFVGGSWQKVPFEADLSLYEGYYMIYDAGTDFELIAPE